MKKLIFFLFILFPSFIFSQEAYYRFENNANDETGTHNGTFKDYATSDGGTIFEGSYKGNFNQSTRNRMISNNKIDLSSGGVTISFAFRDYNTTGTVTLFSNRVSQTAKGMSIRHDRDNARISVVTDDGATENMAYSANSSTSASDWVWVTIVTSSMDGQYFKVYINGSLSGTDSIAQSGSAVNDTISIGAERDGGYTSYDYVDNFSIYKCRFTTTQITAMYNNRTSNYTETCGSGCPSMTGGVIAADQNLDSGDDVAAFTSTSSASGGTGTISYQWKYSTNSSNPLSGTWTNTGTNSTTYNHGTITQTTYFYRAATAATCGTANSNVLTATINTTVVGSIEKFILHNQYALIPDDAIANDYVVDIVHNQNWHIIDESDGLVYEFVSGNSTIFKIDGAALKINDPATLVAGSYEVVYRVVDSVFYDEATIYIKVAKSGNCVYYSQAGSDGSGTRASPHNYIPTTLSSGDTVLFNRGKTIVRSNNAACLTDQYATGIVMGAYGVGVRPVLKNTGYTGSGVVYIEHQTDNVTIRDIEFRDNASTFFIFTGYPTSYTHENIIIDNCNFKNAGYLAVSLHGIRSGRFSNCHLDSIQSDGVNGQHIYGYSATDRWMVEGNHFSNIGLNGESGSGDCWQYFENGQSSHITFRFNFFDRSSTPYKHCLLIASGAAYATENQDQIVEYNRFLGYNGNEQNLFTCHRSRGLIFRYNELENGVRQFFNTIDDTEPESCVASNQYNAYMKIYGNVFKNARFAAIELHPNASGTQIYNNTIVGYCYAGTSIYRDACKAIDNTGAGCPSYAIAVSVFNNIFVSTLAGDEPYYWGSGGFNIAEGFNIFWPDAGNAQITGTSIIDNPDFVTGYFNAYEINSTSPAYQAGFGNFNPIYDIFNDPYRAPLSIGAKEWVEYNFAPTPPPIILPTPRRRIILMMF